MRVLFVSVFLANLAEWNVLQSHASVLVRGGSSKKITLSERIDLTKVSYTVTYKKSKCDFLRRTLPERASELDPKFTFSPCRILYHVFLPIQVK